MTLINLATKSYIDELIEQQKTRWDRIILFRDYTEGKQPVKLSEKQKQLIAGEDGTCPDIILNVCSSILSAEATRLKVRSFTVIKDGEGSSSEELTKLVNKWWKRSEMSEGQLGLHHAACRDADSFLLLSYDKDKMRPVFSVNQVYDGEEAGVDMFYPNGDPANPNCAVKIWEMDRPVKNNHLRGRTLRKNIYFSDRIEYYITPEMAGDKFSHAGWRPLTPTDPGWEEDMVTADLVDPYGTEYVTTVSWWTESSSEDGEAIGIPVAHFRRAALGSDHGVSTLNDVVPGLQDTINMTSASLLAATMLTGFKVVWATKFDPEDNKFEVFAGAIIYNTEDGSFGQLSETNLEQLIDVKNSYIKDAAMLTSTPLNFFNLSGDIPASGTLRQLEAGLLSKVEMDKLSFENSYVYAVKMAIALESVFGDKVSLSLEDIEDLDVSIEWLPIYIQNEESDIKVAEGMQRLGVPDEYIWRKLGYETHDIEIFKKFKEEKEAKALELMQQTSANGRNGNGTDPEGKKTGEPDLKFRPSNKNSD